MYDEKEVNQCIDLMAKRATLFFQEGETGSGWGQFIDAPRSHFQVGTYGTASGILLLTSAGTSENLAKRSLATLSRFWRDWEQDSRSDRRFVQNSKLAFANLAVQSRSENDALSLSQKLQAEFKRRMLAGGLWGSWWISPELHDGQVDILISSLVIISYFGFRPHSTTPRAPDYIIAAAGILKERVLNTSGIPVVTQALALAAICSAFPNDPGEDVLRELRDLLLAPYQMRGYETTYYYDYQYLDTNTGQTVYDREFIVVPADVLLLIASQKQVKSGFILTSSYFIVQDIIDKILENQGFYKVHSNEMAGSMVQAWVALALAATRARGGAPNRFQNTIYWLLAEKPKGILWDKIVPTVAIVSAGIITVLAADASWIYRIASVCYAIIVGSIWAPSMIKKWIPGYSFRQKNR